MNHNKQDSMCSRCGGYKPPKNQPTGYAGVFCVCGEQEHNITTHNEVEKSLCQVCGEPMPEGEEMFNYHGFSGPCPKPPLKRQPETFEKFLIDNAPCLDEVERDSIIKFHNIAILAQKKQIEERLPKEKEDQCGDDCDSCWFHRGWNACLAAVKEALSE